MIGIIGLMWESNSGRAGVSVGRLPEGVLVVVGSSR